MASDNENKCLLTQVSIQSSSSDLKINLFDGGNKNNLKDKFEKAKAGNHEYFKYWIDLINNTTGCTEEQIREKKRYLNSIRNARDEQKLSVLHYAAKYFHLDLCRLLIEDYEMDVGTRKDINTVDKAFKRAPIHELLDSADPKVKEQMDILKFFVEEKNADLNVEDKNGNTSLHFACQHRNKDAVKYLVKTDKTKIKLIDALKYPVETNKIKLNIKNKANKTPLEVALEMNCDTELIELIIDNFEGKDLDNDFFFRLLKLKTTDLVEESSIEYVITRLVTMIKANMIKFKFLSVGKMVNYYAEKEEKVTPLQLAIEKNLTKIAFVLIKLGAGLNFPDGEKAITVLAKNCSIEMLEMLNKEYRLDLFAMNSSDQNALHLAANSSAISTQKEQFFKIYIEIVEERLPPNKSLKKDLLSKRDKTTEKDWPISIALKKNCCSIVKMLIEKDRDQLHLIQDGNGNNLTHLVAEIGSIDMLKMLKDKKFNIFEKNTSINKQNQNMLHIAVFKNHSKQFIEALKNLFDANNKDIRVYLNEKDSSSSIPLFVSIKNNNIDVAELLLSYYDEKMLEELNNNRLLIEYVAQFGSIDMLILLETKLKRLEIGNKSSIIAFENGRFEILEKLVSINSNLMNLLENDTDGNSLFHICAQNNNIKGFKYLIKSLKKLQDESAPKSLKECLTQVNSFKQTILHVASLHGYFEFVKEILETNYDFPGIDRFRSDLVFAIDNEEDNCLLIALNGFKSKQSNNKMFQDIANYLWSKYYDLEFIFKRAKEGHLEYFKYLYDEFKISDILRINPNKPEKNNLIEHHLNIKLEIKNAKSKEDNLRSVLHYAAMHGHLSLCQFFIENNQDGFNQQENKNYKINIDIADLKGKTPLNLIIEEFDYSSNTKQIDMIKYFVSNGADIHHADKRGYSVLDYTVISDNCEAIQYLLLENFQLTDRLQKTLPVALGNGSSAVARLLIDKMDTICFESMLSSVKPFHAISSFRSNSEEKKKDLVKLMKFLIEKINTNSLNIKEVLSAKDQYEFMALHLAIKNKNQDLAELLIDQKANLQFTGGPFGNSMMHFAAQSGSTEIFKLLKNHKLNLLAKNSRNETALHLAVFFRNYNFVEILQNEAKIDIVNETDIDGFNVIHLCARETNIKSFEYLIKTLPPDQRQTAIISTVSRNNENILHIATRNKNFEFIKEILDFRFMRDLGITKKEMNKLAKKLVFGKNNLGQTCFHIAAAFGYRTILNHLLEHPDSLFDPDYLITDRDNKLNTAFHLACLKNQEKIVRTLLKFNLNFNEKNSDFLSAIDICCKNGYFELTKLILEQNPLKRSVNINSDHDNIDHPLKLACESGNALLLKYLINNGANLNFKNRSQDNVNLLDTAIESGNKEMVKTLLVNDTEFVLLKGGLNKNERFKKLCFEMPDLLKLVFDNCNEPEEFDPPFCLIKDKSLNNHPLFVIAESKNRQLLSHKVINRLLDNKWYQFPIWFYYINLALYLIFLLPFTYLILFTTNKTNKLSLKLNNPFNSTNSTLNLNYSSDTSNLSALEWLTIVFLAINIFKELFQWLLVNGIRYFYELDNIIELGTYIFAFIFLIPISSSPYFYKSEMQRIIAPICGLSAWLVLALFIQKIPKIGIFGVMFKKILHKSFKFFPIFCIFIFGFSLSFSIQKKETTEMNLNSTKNFFDQILNTFFMVVGELSVETSSLPVTDSFPRRLVFFCYVSIMCIMILNLMIGIAVGEIRDVVDEADTTSVSMKIKFSLRVQYCLANIFGDFENQMIYSNRQPKYETLKKIAMKLKKFLKFKQSRKTIKEKEVLDSVIDHLNLIKDQLENFKFTIDNKLNLINFEISEIRLDLNAVKAELKNRNSTSNSNLPTENQ